MKNKIMLLSMLSIPYTVFSDEAKKPYDLTKIGRNYGFTIDGDRKAVDTTDGYTTAEEDQEIDKLNLPLSERLRHKSTLYSTRSKKHSSSNSITNHTTEKDVTEAEESLEKGLTYLKKTKEFIKEAKIESAKEARLADLASRGEPDFDLKTDEGVKKATTAIMNGTANYPEAELFYDTWIPQLTKDFLPCFKSTYDHMSTPSGSDINEGISKNKDSITNFIRDLFNTPDANKYTYTQFVEDATEQANTRSKNFIAKRKQLYFNYAEKIAEDGAPDEGNRLKLILFNKLYLLIIGTRTSNRIEHPKKFATLKLLMAIFKGASSSCSFENTWSVVAPFLDITKEIHDNLNPQEEFHN